MIVVDTNVVSEFMRSDPDKRVMSWAAGIAPADLCVAAISVEEITFGVSRLPAGARKRNLQAIWDTILRRFEGRLLPFDTGSALRCGEVRAAAVEVGRPMSLPDAQIAGTCLAHGCLLSTRNTKDFRHVEGLALVNPFEG